MLSHLSTTDLCFGGPDTVARAQTALLRQHLTHCLTHSPYYQHTLSSHSIHPNTFSPKDLPSIPVTTKDDLARHNPDFQAIPDNQIADIVQTSGTSGEPTRFAYSAADLQRLARCEELAMRATGVTANDKALLTCTMDRCFVAGLAYFLGLRAVGAAIIRAGQMPANSLADLLLREHPTVLVGVPGFLRKLTLALRNRSLDTATLGVQRMILIGDPLRDAAWTPSPLTRDLESLWAADAYSTYATTETVTACCECSARRGGHTLPQFAIFEILDENNRPLPPGQTGEVTITPLGIEAMPLLRFKTGDISFLDNTPCSCGRTSPRLGPILGRKSQMIKFRGTTLYPPAIFAALTECPAIDEYCLDILTDDAGLDHLQLHVSLACPEGERAAQTHHLRQTLQGRLRVTPDIILESDETMRQLVFPPTSRKAVRCRDKRRGALS